MLTFHYERAAVSWDRTDQHGYCVARNLAETAERRAGPRQGYFWVLLSHHLLKLKLKPTSTMDRDKQ